ncbi:hypothetical protein JQX13_07505 [Archangium violaceum]|uniref:hypothetical protein n=1 Tax=Archangium violaceum TaxID=83451 RepID=UPI00193B01AA|nr:hypothetical protein [Archangium violaceum]QRK09939.1 hypothetical protein JQX13_07505 [Archangium violaceum]
MYQRGDLKEGMTVRSIDGHKLGKVYAVGDTEFHIEKGLFFPKDYSVRYAEISDIRDGEIILAHGKESLRSFSDEEPHGSNTSPGTRTRASDAAWLNAGERTGAPLGHEQRTQDLGNQEIGPYNTEGARASPILTEEDRARGVGIPVHREGVDRPVMRASSEDTVVGTPLRAEQESARSRVMLSDKDLPIVHDELYEAEEAHRRESRDSTVEGTRKLDLSGETDPANKRGF